MKFSRRKMSYLLLCSCLVTATCAVVHLYWLDGIGWALCEVLIGKTEFSSGYSEYKFRHLRIGMSREQVEILLGKPLHKTQTKETGEEIWRYTQPKILDAEGIGANCHYTERNVWMTNNVVAEIQHEFYVD